MNKINLDFSQNTTINQFLSSSKKFLYSLNPLHKKVLKIASIAFACLAIAYVLKSLFFSIKSITKEDVKVKLSVKLNEEQVIKDFKRMYFSAHESLCIDPIYLNPLLYDASYDVTLNSHTNEIEYDEEKWKEIYKSISNPNMLADLDLTELMEYGIQAKNNLKYFVFDLENNKFDISLLTTQWSKLIDSCPNLTHITLRNIDKKTFKMFNKLPAHLESILLINWQANQIPTLPSTLKTLHIDNGSNLKKINLSMLPHLNKLSFNFCKNLVNESIHSLPKNLEILWLMNCPKLNDQALAKLPYLNSIKVHDCPSISLDACSKAAKNISVDL